MWFGALNVTLKIILPLQHHECNSDVLTNVVNHRFEREATFLTLVYDLLSHSVFDDNVTFLRRHEYVWRLGTVDNDLGIVV